MRSQGVGHNWATELNWTETFSMHVSQGVNIVFLGGEGLIYENILICPKLFLFFIIFYQLIPTQILPYFNMLFIDQMSENYSIFSGNLT